MKPFVVLALITLCFLQCSKNNDLQKSGDLIEVSKMADLPDVLKESSGIEMAGNGEFWSFNDSNGETDLYRFNSSGPFLQTLNIENASNKDWEDITVDEAGNLYVGDFGNNDNDRKNLRIYKINASDLNPADNSATAQEIDFAFPDQSEFPPPPGARFFDVESMFAKSGALYLLTKDRSLPFSGNTRLYKIPDTPGDHIAEYLDEFITDKDDNKGQITAADISPDQSAMILLSNGSVWLFQNITGDDFFAGEVLRCDFSKQSDLEGIVFDSENTLYLTNEEKSGSPAQLFRMTIK